MGKKCVLSGYYGFKNFGDEAILNVLVKKLQSNNHDITVISSNPEYTKSVFNNIESIYTFSLKDIAKKIFKSDIVISGGGSLLQDVTSIKSLFYYLGIIFLGLILGKDVIIFAQGIGPIRNPIGRFITMQLLKRCKYVSVRDENSKKLLEKNGIKADLLCDPIFSIETPQLKQKNKTLAIQLRNCKNMNADFINRLAYEVSSNFSDYKIEIYSFQEEIDTPICTEFEKNLKMLNPDIDTVIYKNLTNNEIIEKFSKSEYLIAMRFHAIIIGLLTYNKTLAINYDIKVEKIANEFNLPIINFDTNIKDQINKIKEQNPEITAKQAKNKIFDWTQFDNVLAE